MRLRADAGSAPIEFVFTTTVLLVPLIYLVMALAQIQAGAYAAQSTAISAARTASLQPVRAETRARSLGDLHFSDHGVAHAQWDVQLSCAGDCGQAGARVTATVTARIPIPGVPAIWGSAHIPGVTVRSEHTDRVAPLEG